MHSSLSPICRAAAGGALWILLLAGCGGGQDVPTASVPSDGPRAADAKATGTDEPVTLVANDGEYQSPAQSNEELHPEVSIQTNLGTIRVRLNFERAPRTVANFLYNYVEQGFYDQTCFHYVEQGYLIAAGGYTPSLQEKPVRTPIACEADNGLSNKRGTLAMARHPGYANSATSQFFINLVDNPGLDYRPGDAEGMNGYCVFGEVIEGMDVVDRIAQSPVTDRDGLANTPDPTVIVESITRLK